MCIRDSYKSVPNDKHSNRERVGGWVWGRGIYSGSRTRIDAERVVSRQWVEVVALASSILGIGKGGPSDQVVTGFGNLGHPAECSVCR